MISTTLRKFVPGVSDGDLNNFEKETHSEMSVESQNYFDMQYRRLRRSINSPSLFRLASNALYTLQSKVVTSFPRNESLKHISSSVRNSYS